MTTVVFSHGKEAPPLVSSSGCSVMEGVAAKPGIIE